MFSNRFSYLQIGKIKDDGYPKQYTKVSILRLNAKKKLLLFSIPGASLTEVSGNITYLCVYNQILKNSIIA
ncbi:MAG TPA: hypothetical protein VLQ91_18855 [Draconibacterium sp.]|nr:hypothetical protein [Draconibacterium sp.]